MNRHIFKIGEKVIPLTNRPSGRHQPRVKGKLYIVLGVNYCNKCGYQDINISGLHNGEISDKIDCNCGNSHDNFGLWWTDSRRFIRPEHLEGLMLEKANEEDYESAAELKEMLEVLKGLSIIK